MRRLCGILALALPGAFFGGPAHAQALASPFGTVSQRIDSTTITVEYYRPSARGRTIFGRLVRWATYSYIAQLFKECPNSSRRR